MTRRDDCPADGDDLKLMWRVLANWARESSVRSVGVNLARALEGFPKVQHSTLEQRLPKQSLPVHLSNFGWIVGDPLPRYGNPVVPVVNVVVVDAEGDRPEDLAFRVALLRQRSDGTIHADGWRFESAEPFEMKTSAAHSKRTEYAEDREEEIPAHPYAHAQAIFGWKRGCPCLIHPNHDDGDECAGVDPTGEVAIDAERSSAATRTLDTHPAFPLLATTHTGLAVALVATLYGVKGARSVVRGDLTLERVGGAIGEDLELLRARD